MSYKIELMRFVAGMAGSLILGLLNEGGGVKSKVTKRPAGAYRIM